MITTLYSQHVGAAETSIAHLINPVLVPTSSDLYVAQPITFASLVAAKHFSGHDDDIELLAACFEEDREIVPTDHFRVTSPLIHSVLDFDELGPVPTRRKLPLLRDLLSRLAEESEAEFLVYSNVDIAIMPYFYLAVRDMLRRGVDAMVINRRTVPAGNFGQNDLPLLYSQIGKPHKGSDCFVFHRSLVSKLDLGNVVLGAEFVGSILLWNLALCAKQFAWHKDLHLTFHIGNDRPWKSADATEYREFNRREAQSLVSRLSAIHGSLWRHPRTRHLMPDPQRLRGARTSDRRTYVLKRRIYRHLSLKGKRA